MDGIRFQSSQPQIIASNLPEDVVIEILLKLPTKSLLKFRCVSKNWLSLISNSKFVKSHAQSPSRHRRRIFSNCSPNFSPQFSSYILHPKFNTGAIEEDFEPFDFPFKEMKHRQIEIVGSCDGLVCLVINGSIVMLWNPATRESRVLPYSDTYIKKNTSGLGYGFGYDAFNDDFKVVQSRRSNTLERPIRIYSLRSNSWRNVELMTPLVLIRASRGGVLSNGAIHWLVVLLENQLQRHVIIAINLAKETCDFIPVPADYVTCYSSEVLGASEQNLLLANSDHWVLEKGVNIWMLKEYGVKEYWIKIMYIPDFPPISTISLVLFVSKDGEVIRKDHNDRKILRSYEFRLFCGFIEFGSTIYKESLISPSLKDEVDELPFHEDGFCGLRMDEV